MDLLLNDKNKIIDVVKDLKKSKPEGSTNFFDRIDDFIRNPKNMDMLKRLIDKIRQEQGNHFNLIVTGKFGDWVYDLIKKGRIQINGIVIHVSGSLRSSIKNKSFQIIGGDENRVYNNYFVLLDDSYYSGSTKKEIEKHLKQYNAKILKTYVFYDGSFTKKPDVYSIYRYYDYHSDDVLPIKKLLGILNSIDEPGIPYDNIENQIMRGQIRSIKELLKEIQILKQKFNHGTNININSYGYKREYEKKKVKNYKNFLNEITNAFSAELSRDWIFICADNVKEYEDLMFYLENLGYIWINGEKPISYFNHRCLNHEKVFNLWKFLKIQPELKFISGCSSSITEYGEDYVKKNCVNARDVIKDGIEKHIEKLNKNRENLRLKNIEDDPYGEEEWEINENKDEKTVKQGDIILVTDKLKEWIDIKKWSPKMLDFIGKKYMVCYPSKLDGIDVACIKYDTWFIPFDSLEVIEIKRKYTEQDPYGEEEWEVNENKDDDVKIGSKILILDKLKDWIEERGWMEDMYNLVGKKYTVTNIENWKGVIKGVYIDDPNGGTWFIPFDSFELVDYERRYTEDDPYGEEDWIDEQVNNEQSITVDEFWNRYETIGRKGMRVLLKNKEVEFHAKSKTKIYKGSICGLVPAFFTKENDNKILFDTKEFGTLEVDKNYPIIIREPQANG